MMVDGKLHREIDRLLADNADWRERIGAINLWLHGDHSRLYVRLGPTRVLADAQHRVLDVANIVVEDEFRGQGVFKSLMNFLERKGIPLYIENVNEERLWPFFESRGYQRREIPGDHATHAYFRLTD
jgi:GNAT superfamily N-acetyltransferase